MLVTMAMVVYPLIVYFLLDKGKALWKERKKNKKNTIIVKVYEKMNSGERDIVVKYNEFDIGEEIMHFVLN